MDQPGVETKPIKLISGKSPFCETFFTDAVVPKTNLVHDLNKGWDVAKNLLQHERKMLASMGAGGSSPKSKGKSGSGLANLSKKYVEETNGKIADEGLRQKIAKSDMDGHAFSLTLKRVSEESKNSNHGPSAATSIFKYFGSEHNKRKYEIMIEAMDKGYVTQTDVNKAITAVNKIAKTIDSTSYVLVTAIGIRPKRIYIDIMLNDLERH